MTAQSAHTWLLARWQEHHDLAAAALPWPDVGVVVEGSEQGVPFVASDTTVAHIAANSPSFVLPLASAALEVLGRHAPDPDGDCTACRAPFPGGGGDCYGYHAEYVPSPCPEVLAWAAPWRGREDYPEELKR